MIYTAEEIKALQEESYYDNLFEKIKERAVQGYNSKTFDYIPSDRSLVQKDKEKFRLLGYNTQIKLEKDYNGYLYRYHLTIKW